LRLAPQAVERRRDRWRRSQRHPIKGLVLSTRLDEDYTTRNDGWWGRGEPLLAKMPHEYWQTMTP
jgi:hypothetical protein